jgi:hypothetical protein
MGACQVCFVAGRRRIGGRTSVEFRSRIHLLGVPWHILDPRRPTLGSSVGAGRRVQEEGSYGRLYRLPEAGMLASAGDPPALPGWQ